MAGKLPGYRIARAGMLIGSVTAAAVVFVATETAAQPSSKMAQRTLLASLIGKPIKPFGRVHVIAASLRTLADMQAFQAAHPSLGLRQTSGGPLIPMDKAAYEAAKRQVAAAPYGAKPGARNAPPPVAPTTIIRNFTGPKESDPGNGAFPPDSSGAISPTGIVVPVNLTYNVYSRTGTLQQTTTFAALLGTADKLRTPRVLYDTAWGRWVFSASDLSSGSEWLAISATSDAKGAYWIYHLDMSLPAGDVCDYGMLGMTQDAILFTCNHFNSSAVFQRALAFAGPKAKLYNGLPWGGAVLFPAPTASGTLAPPIVQNSSASAYFIGSDLTNNPNAGDGTIDVYKGTNLSNEGDASYVLQAQIPAHQLGVPRNANQLNTTLQLNTGDGRFQWPSTQYAQSSDGHTVLWNVKTGDCAGFPCVYYYEIDTITNTILQSSSIFQSATSDDFNGSIAVNSNDEAIVTWTSTDTHNGQNAMVIFSGRDSTDGLGDHIGPGTVLTGSNYHLTGNTKNGVELWGSYSSVALDPYNATFCGGPNRRAAIVNEYIRGVSTWGVKVGIVGFC